MVLNYRFHIRVLRHHFIVFFFVVNTSSPSNTSERATIDPTIDKDESNHVEGWHSHCGHVSHQLRPIWRLKFASPLRPRAACSYLSLPATYRASSIPGVLLVLFASSFFLL
ncbi:unnamed protein product [Musa acuminata subsp. burmannicoides]